MTILLNANICPPIQTATDFLSVLAAQASPNAPVAETMVGPAILNFRQLVVDPHASRLALLSRFGATNAYAIAQGSSGGTELSISLVSGRNILIHKGYALIGDVVGVYSDFTYGVPNSGAGTYWIWLQQSGVPIAQYNTLSPPSGPCCLLGSIVDTAGALGTPDTSGVMYLKGGQLIRYSADAGGPTDTPATGIQFKHSTAFATYHYDGASYKQIGLPQVTADPASPVLGDQWFRTDTGQLKLKAGGSIIIVSTAGAAVTSVNGYTGVVVIAQSDIAGLVAALAAKEVSANKGAAGGYAPLNGSSLVPTSNLPPFATVTTYAGSGAPSVGLGINGDNYIDISGTGNVYQKSGGLWAVAGSSSATVTGTAPIVVSAGNVSAPTVATKSAGNVTLGSLATTSTFAHGLGTNDVTVAMYDTTATPNSVPITSVVCTTTNSVTLTFAAVAAGTYRVVVIGR